MSEGLPAFANPTDSRDLTLPRFYMRPMENSFKSKEAGRPIFEDTEYVEILIPGARGTLVDQRVTDEHRKRWPGVYAAFKAGQEIVETGTPLEEWPAISRSLVEELRHFHVRTVEVLAALDDAALQRAVPMGGFALREKAKLHIEQAAGAAPAERLAAENDQLRARLTAMEERTNELAELVERLTRERMSNERA